MAQLAVGLAGAALGFAVGGPTGAQFGFVIGSAIGQTFTPNQKSEGPRLEDLKASGYEYGAVIAQTYGNPRVPGVVVWASDKIPVENTTESGGKGGGGGQEVTTYTYKQDVLYMVSANEIGGIRRIWANGKLVWTQADDATSESLVASTETDAWEEIDFFLGSDSQLPWSVYEAAVGVGNAPAMRGRGCVAITGLNLGSSGYAPQLTFEVVPVGAVAGSDFATEWEITASGLSGVDANNYPSSILRTSGVDKQYYNANTGNVAGDYTTDPGVEVEMVDFDYSTSPAVGNQGYPHLGASDVECMMVVGTSLDTGGPVLGGSYSNVLGYFGSGTVEYFFEPEQGINRKLYQVIGDVVYFANANNKDKKVWRFNKSGGNATAVSSAFSDWSSGLAASRDYVFNESNSTIYQLDPVTLATVDSFTKPAGTFYKIFCGDDGELYLLQDTGAFYRRNFGTDAWDLVATYGTGLLPSAVNLLHPPSFRGGALSLLLWNWTAGTVTSSLIVAVSTLPAEGQPLDEVVEDLCRRSGLADAYVDASALEPYTVNSLAVTSVTPARGVIETLMQAYSFSAIEGNTLKFVLRGGASVASPDYDELGAAEGDSTDERLPIKRNSDIEVPAQVAVTYANINGDYQAATEYSDRLIGGATGVLTIQLPLGFTAQQAKRVAEINLLDAAIGSTQIGPVGLTRYWSELEPTDVITLTDSTGSTFRVRIVRITDAGGVRSLEVVLDDASVINSSALTDGTYTGSTVVTAVDHSNVELLDIPILRDADNEAGHYGAFGPQNNSGTWPGGVLVRGVNDAAYTEVARFSDRAIYGLCTSTLGDWTGGTVFDERNTVTVSVNGALVSYTRDEIINGTASAYLIGSEILYARTATFVSAGVYTLSGLLRGRRGTEWAMVDHVANERCVLLQTTGLRRVPMDGGQLGVEFSYKAVSFGKRQADATLELFTNEGIGLKPFAPVDLRVSGGGGTYTVTWKRRSRLSTRFTGTAGINCPLGESSERYTVEVYNSSDVLQSTQTVTAATATVSASATDYVVVYQISDTVGNGYPAQVTI